MTGSTVPDLITAVVGYRQWRVDGDRLLPLWKGDVPWHPGQNHAVCRGSLRHAEIPGPDCTCGLHARYHLEFGGGALRRPHTFDRINRPRDRGRRARAALGRVPCGTHADHRARGAAAPGGG